MVATAYIGYGNPTACCTGTCTCCVNQIVLVIDAAGMLYRRQSFDIDAALASLKTAAVVRLECWVEELLAVPRRMKRPFPRCLPGPNIVACAVRPLRRNRMRYRRLWRHARRDWL